MANDPRAVRDPVLYNAALSDACAAMQRWFLVSGNYDLVQPLTEAEIVAALTEQVEALRQPLK
jgi:hypothetical protein